jgi:hypothetical protein
MFAELDDFQSALRDEGFVRGSGTQGFVRCGELHPGLLPVAPPGLEPSRCGWGARVLLSGYPAFHRSKGQGWGTVRSGALGRGVVGVVLDWGDKLKV